MGADCVPSGIEKNERNDMYDAFVKFILIAALLQLGHDLTGKADKKLRQAKVSKIEWKAISVFPEESRRFK